MDTDSWIALGLLALSLFFVELSAIADVAVASASRSSRQAMNGNAWLVDRRDFLPTTVLTLRTLSVVAATGLISLHLLRGGSLTFFTLVWTLALAAIATILLQAVAGALARLNPEQSLRMVSKPLRVLDLLLRPFTGIFDLAASLFTRLVPERRPDPYAADAEDLQTIVEEIGEREEPLEEEEREMIRRIIGLESTMVREIMVPRPDIIAAEADAPLSKGIELIVQHGVSRIPIYDETIDEVVGVVYAKDMLRASHREEQPGSLRELARKPHFVPESKHIDELLKELRENHVHMSIVVDEYGGTAGLVSLEDLLEEIVGEIEDEYDTRVESIHRVSDNEAILDARLSISDLNDLFGLSITQDDFSTVGGLVYSELGKIPSVGDKVSVDGLTISVLATSGRRIKQVRAIHNPHSDDDHD